MTRSRDKWLTVRSAVCHFVVVAGLAWALPGQVETSRPPEQILRCGLTARPIPVLVPGQTPDVVQDTGPEIVSLTDGEVVLFPLPGCGAGAGLMSLVSVCVLGASKSMPTYQRRPDR